MKIINLHSKEEKLIKACLKNDARAQYKLYDKYAPKILGVCKMYVNDLHHAEDCLSKVFVKVFANLNKFEFAGSFEGWIRKICIRECIDFLRKKEFLAFNENYAEIEQEEIQVDFENLALAEEILNQLPKGYQTIFIMKEVEDYNHAEISKLLGISENTSRSQLWKAKKKIQELLLKTKTNETASK